MAVKKKTGIAEGRSFTAGTSYDGAMKQIKDFLVTTVGWTLLYDNSSDPSNPYIYLSNKAYTARNDNTQVYVGIGFDTADSGNIKVKTYLDHDGATSFISEWGIHEITTYDDAEFELHLRSDTELTFINITTKLGSSVYSFHYDDVDISKTLVEDSNVNQKVTGYTRDVDTTRADITFSDVTGFVIGNNYMLMDTTTLSYVLVTIEDIVSTTVSVVKTEGDNMPASIAVGSNMGGNPYQFYSFLNGDYRTPVTYDSNGDDLYVRNNDMSSSRLDVNNVLSYTNPKAVVYPVVKTLDTGYDASKLIPGGTSSLLYGTGFGAPLATGITISATNYVMTYQDYFVEDGTV